MEIPRRVKLYENTPAELAIYNAMQEVEKLGADVRLTNVVVMLANAKDMLSDYVDDKTLIGMDLEIAQKELKQRNIDYRIVRKDKTNYMITSDFVHDRLNLEVDNGIITNVYGG